MNWFELSCGGCGSADMRLQGSGSPLVDIRAICQGCGSVTHLTPSKPTIQLGWGDQKQGEKDLGRLCNMRWPNAKP